MKQAISKTYIAALVLIMLMGAGCKKNINTTNSRVVFANTLLAGAQSCDLVASGLVAANDTIESLQASEPDYYAKVKPILQKIARANDKAIAAIRAAKAGDNSVDWRAALINVSSELGNEDLSVFGFRNPNSQALVRIGLASLNAAIVAISNTWGTK